MIRVKKVVVTTITDTTAIPTPFMKAHMLTNGHIRQFVSRNTLTQSHGRRDIEGMKEITISIANQGSAAFECNAYNNCYNHKYVVDLGNINLPMIFF